MPTRSRKSAPTRRDEIRRAVLRIVGRRGLPSLTAGAIAAEVGLTSGALYRHFASLDEILVDAVRDGVARIEATFPDPALPPLERVLALARNRASAMGRDRGLLWLLRDEHAHLTLPREAVTQLREIKRRSRAFVLSALRQGMRQGEIRRDIPAEVLLVPTLGTVHAAITQGRGRGEVDPDRVLDALATLLRPRKHDE